MPEITKDYEPVVSDKHLDTLIAKELPIRTLLRRVIRITILEVADRLDDSVSDVIAMNIRALRDLHTEEAGDARKKGEF